MLSAPSFYFKVSDDSLCTINFITTIEIRINQTYLKLENMYSTMLGWTKKNKIISVAMILDIFLLLDTLFLQQKYKFQNNILPRARSNGSRAYMIIF